MARPVKRFLGRYVYSPKVARYFRRSDGRLVPPSEIITEVERVIRREEEALTTLGEQLEAGEISLRQWQLAVRDEVKMIHTAMAAAAEGGLRRLDAAARRDLEKILKPQLQYLKNFALQVDAGAQALDGNFYKRLRAYARSSRNTYQNSETNAATRRGVLMAKRVLSIAEHCVGHGGSVQRPPTTPSGPPTLPPPAPPTLNEPWQITTAEYTKLYARASASVDGRAVGENVPNESSIASSLEEYSIVEGIREVPMAAFEIGLTPPIFYSATEEARTIALAEKIRASKKINPLIVAYDDKGPYILEGGHRFDALRLLGAKSLPAKIVIDEEAMYNAVEAAIKEGKPVREEVLAEYPDLKAKAPPPPPALDPEPTRVATGGTPGCVELAALGYVPIGRLIPIGGATCRYNCKCKVVYREAVSRAALNKEGARIRAYVKRQNKKKAA